MYDTLKKIQGKIQEAAIPREEALIGGAPENWAEYQRLVGEISGLKQAHELVEEFFNLHEDDDLD